MELEDRFPDEAAEAAWASQEEEPPSSIQEVLGVTDEQMADVQAEYAATLRRIEESERRAFLAARDCRLGWAPF